MLTPAEASKLYAASTTVNAAPGHSRRTATGHATGTAAPTATQAGRPKFGGAAAPRADKANSAAAAAQSRITHGISRIRAVPAIVCSLLTPAA